MITHTAGGYTVETISTVDRGRYFIVKTPHHIRVSLDPWLSQGPDEIRTTEQLTLFCPSWVRMYQPDLLTIEHLTAASPVRVLASNHALIARQELKGVRGWKCSLQTSGSRSESSS